ncbi:MAG: hypothetical protein LBT62_00425 [Deltaproteobacteria bacterium]|jgi:hypothetical protein|nr:hypothetical protein [Deltaproteobacteria bacterium]
MAIKTVGPAFRRILSAIMMVIFLPFGFYILWIAFEIDGSPHVFVMFIFSGSLMSLIGVAGLLGLISKIPNTQQEQVDEKSGAEGGGDS